MFQRENLYPQFKELFAKFNSGQAIPQNELRTFLSDWKKEDSTSFEREFNQLKQDIKKNENFIKAGLIIKVLNDEYNKLG